MDSRPLRFSDLPALRELAAIATAEGFRFVERFVTELTAAPNPADLLAGFVGLVEDEQLVAFGGVIADPYRRSSEVGRLRHLYVRPDHRRRGLGAYLVELLEARASAAGIRLLRLRTDARAAALFYARLGYDAISDAHATHERRLGGDALRAST